MPQRVGGEPALGPRARNRGFPETTIRAYDGSSIALVDQYDGPVTLQACSNANSQAQTWGGERLLVKEAACPECERTKILKRLPANFRCAAVICEFCGYLAQVKASTSKDGQ